MQIYAYLRLSDMMFPLFEGDIRLIHPDIEESLTGDSFPCPENFKAVYYIEEPEYNKDTHKAVISTAEFINCIWQVKWDVLVRDFELEKYYESLIIKPREDSFKLDEISGGEPDVIG
jgi:hypothetical protein